MVFDTLEFATPQQLKADDDCVAIVHPIKAQLYATELAAIPIDAAINIQPDKTLPLASPTHVDPAINTELNAVHVTKDIYPPKTKQSSTYHPVETAYRDA